MEPKNDSISALSYADATFPIDPIRPASRSLAPKSQEVNCAPRVGVDDGSDGFASPSRDLDRVDDQLGANMIRDRPADATPGEHIDHRGAVNPAFTRPMLGDVRDPKVVRGVGQEHAFHLVFEYRRQSTRRTVTPLAMVVALQPSQPHQTLDSALTDPQAPAED
jgi:hypothetical protein